MLVQTVGIGNHSDKGRSGRNDREQKKKKTCQSIFSHSQVTQEAPAEGQKKSRACLFTRKMDDVFNFMLFYGLNGEGGTGERCEFLEHGVTNESKQRSVAS
jgi:hypothetical protein